MTVFSLVMSACFGQTSVPSDVKLFSDVEYGKGGASELKMDILTPKKPPKDPMPVLVFIHGGGWVHGDKSSGIPKLLPFAKRGYLCASINYRLTGEAIFPAQIEDCKCAIRFLRAKAGEYNLDPTRIGVWGESAGGHLVSLLGTTGDIKSLGGKGGWGMYSSKVQAVCNFYGPSDFTKYIEDTNKLKQLGGHNLPFGMDYLSLLVGGPADKKLDACRSASPITYVSKDDPPFLIVQGEKDEIVPQDQAIVLDAALRKVGVESTLYIIKGAGHGFGERPEVDKMVVDFFNKHLVGK